MKITQDTLTTEIFLDLYSSVGWEPPCKKQVETALQNTLMTFTAWEGGTPVGMVRLLGDGGTPLRVGWAGYVQNGCGA